VKWLQATTQPIGLIFSTPIYTDTKKKKILNEKKKVSSLLNEHVG